MEELTRENIRDFVDQLRALLEGRIFSYLDRRNFTYTNMTLRRPLEIIESREGSWIVELDMGGIIRSISTCYETPGGRLTITRGDPYRTWFEFSKKSLRVLTQVPGYKFETLFTI